MDNINPLAETKPNFSKYYEQAKELLSKKIKPSKPIVDLVNDSLIQEWVRQGIERHKDKRDTCGFCGNPINANLWGKLDAHFRKESEDLRKALKKHIDALEQAKKNLSEFLTLNRDMFYGSLAPKFDAVQKNWNSIIKTYSGSIDDIITELKNREKDIFKEKEIPTIADV